MVTKFTDEFDATIRDAVLRGWVGCDWLFFKAQRQAETGGEKDPVHAVSSTGAKGLFQLMPSVCAQFKVIDPFDPKENARGAVEAMSSIWTQFMRESDMERMKLSWAGYNCGEHHVFAAQKLAEAAGVDSRIWDNVQPFLAQLTKPEGSRAMSDDSVNQVTDYVARILNYYNQLKAS